MLLYRCRIKKSLSFKSAVLRIKVAVMVMSFSKIIAYGIIQCYLPHGRDVNAAFTHSQSRYLI